MRTLGKHLSLLSLAPAAVQDTVIRPKANFVPFRDVCLIRFTDYKLVVIGGTTAAFNTCSLLTRSFSGIWPFSATEDG